MNGTRIELSGRAGDFPLDVSAAWSERVAVLFGPSGSGKTTVLEAVLGLRPELRGTIVVAGRTLEDAPHGVRLPIEGRGLGWVPQDPTLLPHLRVADDLRLGLRRAGADGEARLARAVEVLELGPLLARRPRQLSGGERQRVALARALASGPDALLLDEPLASLDLPLRRRVLPYLLRVRDELRLPMLYVTHDPDEAMVIGEIAIVLAQGRVVATGPPREVLWSRAVLPLSQALGVENVLDGRARESPREGGSVVETEKGLRLVVPGELATGEPVRLGLRAEEILLAADPPGRVSARNVLAATVSAVEAAGGDALVRLDVCGERLVAKVTPGAVATLGLREGGSVYAVIKAQSLRRL